MRTILAAVLMPGALLAASTPNASGTITIGKETIPMKYAQAIQFPDWFDKSKFGTRLVVSDVPVPAAAMSDPFAMMDAVRDGRIHAVQFEIGAEGTSFTMSIQSNKVEGSASMSSNFDVKTLKVYTPVRIEGALSAPTKKMFDMSYSYDVRFATDIAPRVVPVAPTAADTASAAKSASAQAYLAFNAAVRAGNKAKMLELSSPKVRQMMDRPDFAENLKFIQSMMPNDIKVLKAQETGDNSTLTVSGNEGGKTKNGTVTMLRVNGKWTLVKESWKSTM